jgi:hypothetical protein
VLASSCAKFECYANVDYACQKARNFCSKGDTDKALCESLEIDGKACKYLEKRKQCRALSHTIHTFISIPNYKCHQLAEDKCEILKECELNYYDPGGMKFSEPEDIIYD